MVSALAPAQASFDTPLRLPTGSLPSSIAVADFNADGVPDVVTANTNSANVSILMGRNGSTFSPKVDYVVGSNPRAVATADFNADGRPDLAIANASSNSVSVLLAQPGGTFAAKVDCAVGNNPLALAIGDLNSDGQPDLVVPNQASNTVSILFGQPAGTFGSKTDYPTDTSATLTGLNLGFTDNTGTSLTTSQAQALLQNVSVWQDADNSNTWGPTDTLVGTTMALTLADGAAALPLNWGPAVQIGSGTPKTYFVTVTTTVNAQLQTPNTLRVIHYPSTATDALFQAPLRTEFAPNSTTPDVVAVPVALSHFTAD